jgi:hypothetical protein
MYLRARRQVSSTDRSRTTFICSGCRYLKRIRLLIGPSMIQQCVDFESGFQGMTLNSTWWCHRSANSFWMKFPFRNCQMSFSFSDITAKIRSEWTDTPLSPQSVWGTKPFMFEENSVSWKLVVDVSVNDTVWAEQYGFRQLRNIQSRQTKQKLRWFCSVSMPEKCSECQSFASVRS